MRIAIAHDHPLAGVGVASVLKTLGKTFVLDVQTSEELITTLGRAPGFDVLVLAGLGSDTSIALQQRVVQEAQRACPSLALVLLVNEGGRCAVDALRAMGVRGILNRRAEAAELMAAVRAVRQGGTYILLHDKSEAPASPASILAGRSKSVLTKSELSVLRLLSSGYSLTAIASMANKSVKTISAQKRSAMRRVGVENDQELYEYLRVQSSS